VRELVGDDGHEIADFMFSVMADERARNADRIDAAKWLADRGFGRAAIIVDAGVTPEDLLREYFKKLSLEDLQTIQMILEKHSPDADQLRESRELRAG
jgi:hypothetical protein